MSNGESNLGHLPSCAICQQNIGIYRCPRCQTRTCSLACCRAHKVCSSSNNGTACNGKRNRTQFCTLKGYTDSQLTSDYHFLEDVLKVSESSKRVYQDIVTGNSSASCGAATAAKRARGNHVHIDKKELESISTKSLVHPLLRAKERKSFTDIVARGMDGDDPIESGDKKISYPSDGIITGLLTTKPVAESVPPKRGKVDPLVRQAKLKGVHLLRMPSGLERHRSNCSKFNKKKGVISWKIELCFHPPKITADVAKEKTESCSSIENASSSPALLKVESEATETTTLSEELAKHLDVHPSNSTTRVCLRMFAAVPRNSLVLLMKRLPCSSAAPQYFKLDPNATLAESLEGRTIIEYPTIDVVLDTDKSQFPLFIGELPRINCREVP